MAPKISKTKAQLAAETELLGQILERRTRETRVLAAAISAVARTSNLDEIFQAVIQGALELVSAERGALLLWDEAEQVLIPAAAVGFDWEQYRQLRLRPGEGTSGQVFVSGQTLSYNHQGSVADPTFSLENQTLFLQAAEHDGRGLNNSGLGAAVPLKTGPQVIGTLSVRNSSHPCSAEDLVLLGYLADAAAVAISRAQQARALEIEVGLLRVRSEALQMRTAEDWRSLGSHLKLELASLIPSQGYRIALVDLNQRSFYVWDLSGEEPLKGERCNFLPRSLEEAVRRQTSQYRRTRQEQAQWEDNVGPERGSVLDAPFSGGTLGLSRAPENAFSHQEIRCLERFARVCSEAHDRLRHIQQEAALSEVRQTLWQMMLGADFHLVILSVREQLRRLNMPVANWAVHFVSGTEQAPFVRSFIGRNDLLLQQERDTPEIEEIPATDLGAGLIRQFWEGARTIYRPDLQADDPYLERERLEPGTPGIRSLIDIPFVAGTLALSSRVPQAFSAMDISFFERLAIVIGEAFARLADLELLTERERSIRATLDALSAHIAVLDGDGYILTTNRAWKEFAAQNGAPGGLIGEKTGYLEVCDRAAAAGDADAAMAAAHIRAVMAGQSESEVFQYACHSPQEERWFHFRVSRFPGDGPLRVVVAHENITAQVKALQGIQENEQRYAAILEAAMDAIIVIDGEHRIVLFNRAAEHIFGAPSWHMVGHPVHELLPAGLLDSHTAAVSAFALGTESVRAMGKTRPITGRRADGEQFPAEATISRLERKGEVYMTVVLRDITERRRAEQAILQAKKEAENADLAKTTFLANMSHEIRTPMNAVLGMAEVLQGTELDPSQQRYLSLIQQSGTNLLEIINQLLDLSKIEAGRLELVPEPFSLNQCLDQSVNLLLPQAKKKGLDLLYFVDPEIPPYLDGDPLRLTQILMNLLGNTLKFTRQGEVVLRVDLAAKDQTAVQLHFTVRDTGPGIPEDKLEAVFEPFTQVESAKQGGTGLGLAITRQLVEMMGGTIWMESTLGEGTTVYFTLRLGVAAKPAREDQPPVTTANQGPGPSFRPLRCLLAEDVEANQLLVTALMERAGHAVVVVENGREAVERLEREPFDLVLMDVQMPEMDGLAATRAIRTREQKQGGHVPIIAMTAQAMPQDQERCLEAGMDAYLSKPFNRTKLFATIDYLLETAPSAGAALLGTAAATTAAFSAEEVWDQFEGDGALLRKTVASFLAAYPKYLAQIREALDHQDAPALHEVAHTLKGPIGLFGPGEASRLTDQLERLGRAGDLAQAPALYAALESALLLLEQNLLKLLETAGGSAG